MEYVVMLQRAWQILTRHKLMWLFGFLATLAGQDAMSNLHGGRAVQPLADSIVGLPPIAGNLVRAVTPANDDILLIAVTIVLGLALLFVGMLASAAMIGLTQAAERGDPVDLKAGLHAGFRHIDRLIIIRLIFNMPFVILSLLGFTLLLRGAEADVLLPIFLIASLIVGAFIGAIGIGADRGVVIDGMDVVSALRQGWETLRDHIGKYIAITGIFVSTLLLSALVLACPVIIIFTDRLNALTGNAALTTDNVASALLTEPVGIVILGLGILIYAALTSFTSILWTLAYRRYAR